MRFAYAAGSPRLRGAAEAGAGATGAGARSKMGSVRGVFEKSTIFETHEALCSRFETQLSVCSKSGVFEHIVDYVTCLEHKRPCVRDFRNT